MYMGFAPPVQTFFIAILFGMVIGVFWDVNRVLKNIFKYKNLFKKIIFVLDVVFCVAVCVLTIYFFFVFTYSGFRLFVLVGEFIGVILYFCTITKFLYYILKIIIENIIKFFALICSLIKKIVNITIKNLKFIIAILYKKYKNKKNKKNKKKITCFYDVNKYIMKKIEKFTKK